MAVQPVSDTSSTAGSAAADQADGLAGLSVEAAGPAKEIFQTAVLGTDAEIASPDEDADVVTCIECYRSLERVKCQQVGTGKKLKKNQNALFKCNECNALRSRMNRMFQHRGGLAQDWLKLSHEQKADFMLRSHALAKEELVHGVEAHIEMTKTMSTDVHHGQEGEYLPLSVYEARGYSKEHLANIEKNAPKQFNVSLGDWTFQVFVESSGSRDSEVVTNRTAYAPASKRASSATDPSHTPSAKKNKTMCPGKEELASQKKAQHEADQAARKEAAEQQAARKVELQFSKKVLSMLAPVIIEGHQLLRGKCNQASIASKLPDCVLKECNELMRQVELANNLWQEVMAGQKPPAELMEMTKVTELKKRATKAFSGLATMINIAVGN